MVSSTFTAQANSPKPLSVTILVIYLLLLQPVTYIFYRHGPRSWLAWFPLQSLCVLRVVGSGLQIHADARRTSSTSSIILTNIGLAPLLLASLGILHEARAARNPHLRRKLERFMVIQFHCVVIAAVVLVIIGVVTLLGTHPQESDKTFSKVGVAIILLCWLVLVAWVAASFRTSQYDMQAPAYRSGTKVNSPQILLIGFRVATANANVKLLFGVIVAIPFLGLRLLDAFLSSIVTSETFFTSLPVKVCLSVVPEMIATVSLTAQGFAARDIRGEMKNQRKIDE